MSAELTLQPQKKTTQAVRSKPAPLLQRTCACGQHTGGSECEECRKKKQALQRKPLSPLSYPPYNQEIGDKGYGVPPIVHEALHSHDHPLDEATRADMEPRFGFDFSRVRVHADAQAAESAREVNALAYTVGRDVVFGAGQYAPGTLSGRRLLAHELAHVVQQNEGLSAKSGSTEGDVSDEAEADHIEQSILSGQEAYVKRTSGIAMRRQGAPSSDIASRAATAELLCDLKTLCALRFAAPTVVTPERVRALALRCRPSLSTTVDPCLVSDIATLPAGPTAGPGAAAPSAATATPTPKAAGPSTGSGLPGLNTTLRFNLGAAQFVIDLPNSVTATLPVPFSGAQIIEFSLQADVPNQFSFSATINAVPHVRIVARVGADISSRMATAGLVIETTRTTCRVVEPAEARSQLQSAGQQLRDAIQAVQTPPPLSPGQDATIETAKRLKDVGSAIYGVHQAIEKVRGACQQVPVFSFELGARMPFEGPSGREPERGGYLGGTATWRF